MIETNVGEVDSHLRLGIGLLALLLGVLGFTGMLKMVSMPFSPVVSSGVLVVLGLFLTTTGYLRTCPLYSLAGYETN